MPGASLSHFPGASPQCIWSILGAALDESKPKICYLSHPFTATIGYLPRRTGHYIFDHEASAEEKKRILGDTVQEKAFFFDVHSFP